MILVIGRADDDHVRYVTRRLDERGSLYWQFDPRDYPSSVELSVQYDRGGVASRTLKGPQQELDLNEVGAVLHRTRDRPLALTTARADQIWWISESCARFLSQLYEGLNCLWLPERAASGGGPFRTAARNRPDCERWGGSPMRLRCPSAENKLHQLAIAGQLGFAVPRTLVTNSPERFLDFFADCEGQLISKRAVQLAPARGGEAARSYTTLVTRREAANLHALRHGPVVFQENIRKRLEIRATVVGSLVFAAEIRSQESYRQTVDWRHYPEYAQSLYYASHALPALVEQRCIDLLRALGVCFGAIDLILTPDDEYVFLEVNVDGQWAYIEDLLGLPISAAIADLLVRGHV